MTDRQRMIRLLEALDEYASRCDEAGDEGARLVKRLVTNLLDDVKAVEDHYRTAEPLGIRGPLGLVADAKSFVDGLNSPRPWRTYEKQDLWEAIWEHEDLFPSLEYQSAEWDTAIGLVVVIPEADEHRIYAARPRDPWRPAGVGLDVWLVNDEVVNEAWAFGLRCNWGLEVDENDRGWEATEDDEEHALDEIARHYVKLPIDAWTPARQWLRANS